MKKAMVGHAHGQGHRQRHRGHHDTGDGGTDHRDHVEHRDEDRQ